MLIHTKWFLMLASCCHKFNPSVRKIFFFLLIIHYLFIKKFCHLCDRQVFNNAFPSLDDRMWEGNKASFHTLSVPIGSGLFITMSTICIILFICLVSCLLLVSPTRMQSCWLLGLIIIGAAQLLL